VADQALKGKILVIDDERGPRESLRMVLKFDYEVFLADRVDAGIELLRKKKPDLVIMDILQKPFDVNEIQETIRNYVERSRLNRRKSKAQEEMQKMVQSLGREVGKTNKMTSLGAASSELVHDLRNPLTIIRGYLDLLVYELKEKQELNSPGMEDYLDQIEANVERCTSLVESWRALGRVDFSQMERLSLPKLLNDCFQNTGHSEIAFDVKAEGAPEQYEMLGERQQMKRAVQNLVDNAVSALENQSNPAITVVCTLDNADLEIQIRDNGCGIDMAQLRWIFEPLDDRATIEKGAGLGLFITKKVLEEHRGTLQLESRIGEGTTVTMRVPQAHTALRHYARPDAVIES
jgi:signal transduction histidine kinase